MKHCYYNLVNLAKFPIDSGIGPCNWLEERFLKGGMSDIWGYFNKFELGCIQFSQVFHIAYGLRNWTVQSAIIVKTSEQTSIGFDDSIEFIFVYKEVTLFKYPIELGIHAFNWL